MQGQDAVQLRSLSECGLVLIILSLWPREDRERVALADELVDHLEQQVHLLICLLVSRERLPVQEGRHKLTITNQEVTNIFIH